MIHVKKGLTLPIKGSPVQKIVQTFVPQQVALIAEDFVGMKPTMLVQVGDKVKKGQKVFENKKNPGVYFTAPVAGEVVQINRGDKRIFQSMVFQYSGEDQVSFSSFLNKDHKSYTSEEVKNLLLESGLWTTLRTRPFSKNPIPGTAPSSIFVNLMDTNPLAPEPSVVLNGREDDLRASLEVLTKLSPRVFVVTDSKSKLSFKNISGVSQESFEGPHPAGNVGTHIHFLDSVSANKTVWHLNYQDACRIGVLFKTGQLESDKIISIAGPMSRNPRLVKTKMGASVSELIKDELFEQGDIRAISGSVFSGRKAHGPYSYLGQFHLQISLLEEGRKREFLGWHSPGLDKFSLKNIYLSKLFFGKTFNFNTSTNGSHRSVVPIGSYEAVMPMDILPTQLLKSLLTKNTDVAVSLGALELDEEDLALCTFVDPCKNEFSQALRETLNLIEKEG